MNSVVLQLILSKIGIGTANSPTICMVETIFNPLLICINVTY